jgi:carboxyl-terminal processing protease
MSVLRQSWGQAWQQTWRAAMPAIAVPAFALLATACAVENPEHYDVYDQAAATRLFSAGLQDIEEIYIDQVEMDELSLAALNNLSSLDKRLSAELRGRQVALLVDQQETGLFEVPAGDDIRGWAYLTASAVDNGRSHSEALQTASSEDIYEAAFDGMVSELDQFSRYASRDEARDNQASREGFGGIGVRIRLMEKGVEVLQVMEETPAERAGMKDGDVITLIEGQDVLPMDQREVVDRLRGPVGSEVVVTVLRGSQSPFPITVTRGHVVPQTVSYKREGNAAYIRVSGFNQSTTRSLEKKIRLAKQQIGSNLSGIVLDLRGNPGGLLDQSVSVSDLFLGDTRIVSTHGRHPNSHQYFEGNDGDIAEGLPLVILINGGSASASEIVAAALQDGRRAVVIGSNSYGKGSVQTVFRLNNGGEMTITWARFHAPSGYALAHRGVQPDLCTSGEVTMADLRRELATPIHKVRLNIAESVDQPPISEEDAETIRARCPVTDEEAELDLEAALLLIENPGLYAEALGRTSGNLAGRGAEPLTTSSLN